MILVIVGVILEEGRNHSRFKAQCFDRWDVFQAEEDFEKDVIIKE